MLGNLLTLFFGRNYTELRGSSSFPNLPIPNFQTAFFLLGSFAVSA